MNNKKIFFIFGAVAIIIVIIAVLMRDDDSDESTDVDVNVEREQQENDRDDDDGNDRDVDPMGGGQTEPRDTTPTDPKPGDTAATGDAAKPSSAGSAAARRIVEESVPAGVVSSASMNGDALEVVLNANSSDPAMASYFKQGDRLDRLYAIDVPHWFTKVPSANRIRVDLKSPAGTYVFAVTRKQAEEYFGMKLNSDLANPDRWRDEFLERHDTPDNMIRFVNKYMKPPAGA